MGAGRDRLATGASGAEPQGVAASAPLSGIDGLAPPVPVTVLMWLLPEFTKLEPVPPVLTPTPPVVVPTPVFVPVLVPVALGDVVPVLVEPTVPVLVLVPVSGLTPVLVFRLVFVLVAGLFVVGLAALSGTLLPSGPPPVVSLIGAPVPVPVPRVEPVLLEPPDELL
ncbi:hypothetical protein FRZ61_26290 [Hypericibacter adhaerens]|jgi:hypothetical protein|uniref:Uncharacterized protein n=1 Tax=Hypericibacter adhaerens TaxID=2602016 RepID=A0A5J6MZV2_9PROT|nr:hypothetical protein FRZ61_26290 [Hypericibacter adhaerens]